MLKVNLCRLSKFICTDVFEYSLQTSNKAHRRWLTNASVRKKRSEMFTLEAQRQAALVTDIEKIEVQYEDQPESCTLIMNKNISTPFDCAKHINEIILRRSVLAEVNGQPWDLHRPLEQDCLLRFLHFRQTDPYYVNKAFWRGASLMLGSVLETVMKDKFYVELCSFPTPNVRTGSFVYDVDLKMEKWTPTKEELRVLSAEMIKLALANLPSERLEVSVDFAKKMFADNRFKKAQIADIAVHSSSGNSVMLYRMGEFVDISRGPLIGFTGQLGRCTVTAVHPIETDWGHLCRVQGIALPKGIMLNHYTYGIIEERARKLNSGQLPSVPTKGNLQKPEKIGLSSQN